MYKIIILTAVLSGCETWFLACKEQHRLRAPENRVLRRIFGLKRDEVTGTWKKFHNEELHGFYASPDFIRVIKAKRMCRACGR
jgi:hypothetical protein